MRRIQSLVAITLLNLATVCSLAADPNDIPENKQTSLGLYLTPQQAWDMVQDNPDKTLFLDVRTQAEAAYVGMPEGADALVPYFQHGPLWSWDDRRNAYRFEPAENFSAAVNHRLKEKNLTKDDPVIVMCRSGTRSAMAANRLAQEGYTKVYTVVDGFEGDTSQTGPNKGKRTVNGWKNDGLPWSYELQKDKLFIGGL